jgi:hypothetical protein
LFAIIVPDPGVLKSRRIIGHCDLRASFPEAFLDAGVLGGMRGDWVAVDCGERGKRQPGFRDTRVPCENATPVKIPLFYTKNNGNTMFSKYNNLFHNTLINL